MLGNYRNIKIREGSNTPNRSTANITYSSPQGNLPISKEVNRKKSEAEGAHLAPASGYGQHFTKINYLYSF
uniref:Protein p311 n=1 Tax=Zosterops lateralis melanops TaxID=1220523 RepID=A0A8D2QVU3_ZOSLA